MNTMPELKPCKYCKSVPDRPVKCFRIGSSVFFVKCPKCVNRTGNLHSEKAARNVWNRLN